MSVIYFVVLSLSDLFLTIRLREVLLGMGERFSEDEVIQLKSTALMRIILYCIVILPLVSLSLLVFLSFINYDQVSEFMRYAPVDATGKFDYTEFIRLLKHGSKDSATEALE